MKHGISLTPFEERRRAAPAPTDITEPNIKEGRTGEPVNVTKTNITIPHRISTLSLFTIRIRATMEKRQTSQDTATVIGEVRRRRGRTSEVENRVSIMKIMIIALCLALF